MVHEIFMPVFGQTQETATINRWLKQVGDHVEAGDALLEVATDKTTYDVESRAKGYLRQVLYPEGAEVPVKVVIALVTTTADEPLADAAAPAQAPTHAPAETQAAGAPADDPPPRPRAAPSVRRLARELGIDLGNVQGSGPSGRIRIADVEAAARPAAAQAPAAVAQQPTAPPAPAPVVAAAVAQVAAPAAAADRVIPFSPMRQVIARRLSDSFHTAVPVTLTTEAVIPQLAALRAQLAPAVERQHAAKLTWNALVLKAVAVALRQHVQLNATLLGEAVRQHADVNLGVAVAVSEGLVVPVIRGAQHKSIGQIAREAGELAEQARAGRLPPGAFDGGTFTVSNLGQWEIDAFSPILNPPQVGILGVGRVVDKPVAVAGEVVVAPTITLSLVFDHRAVDGAPAAAFLQAVKRLLEHAHDLVV